MVSISISVSFFLFHSTQIPADIKDVVYDTAVRTGSDTEWNFLFEQFKTTKIDSDRQKYMAALSATENPSILLNLLNMTIHREESGIRLQVKWFISGNVLLWPQFFSVEDKLSLQKNIYSKSKASLVRYPYKC